ncbi:four helix bundle protein [Candidatus Shapirobacteria bacterium]|nr:four helix bundle protein [Candidatus Shapirobacteria bacterium]
MERYITLENLEVYILACELSGSGWEVYKNFDWRTKKVGGDQFITSLDSVGANIAEGYGRFHYLDKIKFYYNARGSLLEALHWTERLHVRGLIGEEVFISLRKKIENLHVKLNLFIKSTYEAKNHKIS